MKKSKIVLKIILIVCAAIVIYAIKSLLVIALPLISYLSAQVDINTDITKYNEYMGESAHEMYRNKWGMDETIFPTTIEEDMQVVDYKMVYYNPWDAQYLSYLVVDYTDENYEKEVERLKAYPSTDYIGYYDVTGFSKYTLLAMFADSYQGFVYAITDNHNRIIYVELIFCNYFYDIDYTQYIPVEYLPDGFNAVLDNPYSQKMLK